jgi:hypothetical protein
MTLARARTSDGKTRWLTTTSPAVPASRSGLVGGPGGTTGTIEDHIRCLLDAGFALTNLPECAPVRERFDDEAEFEGRRRISLMLSLAGARG